MVADPGDRTHRDPEQSCLELVDRLSAGEHLRHRHRTGPGEGTCRIAGMRRARTTDDLPLPLGPTTARKRAVRPGSFSRARRRCVSSPRPLKSRASASPNGRSPLYGFRLDASMGMSMSDAPTIPRPPQRTTRRPRPPASTLSARTATGSEERRRAPAARGGPTLERLPLARSARPRRSRSRTGTRSPRRRRARSTRTSPWVTPCRCANARAEAICSITRRARSGSSDSVRASRPSRLPPRRYRVTTYARPGSRQ